MFALNAVSPGATQCDKQSYLSEEMGNSVSSHDHAKANSLRVLDGTTDYPTLSEYEQVIYAKVISKYDSLFVRIGLDCRFKHPSPFHNLNRLPTNRNQVSSGKVFHQGWRFTRDGVLPGMRFTRDGHRVPL
jgi:hypothetical protein